MSKKINNLRPQKKEIKWICIIFMAGKTITDNSINKDEKD
jgi:hypothetical protein